MRLVEYEAKTLLRERGISVPRGILVSSLQGVEEAYRTLGPWVVLKAQVPIGGRSKAGAVAFPAALEELRDLSFYLLGSSVKGFPVEKLLIEERAWVEKELFLAITYDMAERGPLALLSLEGGVDVDLLAQQAPEKVVKYPFDPRPGLLEFQAREAISRLRLGGSDLLQLAGVLHSAAKLFFQYDATLVEINPLGRTREGKYIALDARIELDGDSLYRHPELEERYGIPRRQVSGRPSTPFELKAAEIYAMDHRGVAGRVIEFDGRIGLLIGGGGSSLTTFDAIRRHGGMPANYCEIGGNPSVRKLAELTKLILSKPGVEGIAIIMNIVSNTRVDLVARGVIKGCIEAGFEPGEKINLFRVPGSWEEEGFKILRKYNVPYCDRTVSIDEAARRAVLRQG